VWGGAAVGCHPSWMLECHDCDLILEFSSLAGGGLDVRGLVADPAARR
jgi:hypothetical protein